MSDSVWSRFTGRAVSGFRCVDQARWKALWKELEGKEVEVCIRVRRVKRTLPQNAYIHVIAPLIAEAQGESVKYVKRSATLEALGPEAVEVYDIEGQPFREVRGTSSLFKDEAIKVIDVMLARADFLELRLPDREQVEVMD